MPATVKFERYKPTNSSISQRVDLTEQDSLNLTQLDRTLRENAQFKQQAADQMRSDPDKLIYMIERIKNRCYLRFLPSIYDPGTLITVNTELQTLIDQFIPADKSPPPSEQHKQNLQTIQALEQQNAKNATDQESSGRNRILSEENLKFQLYLGSLELQLREKHIEVLQGIKDDPHRKSDEIEELQKKLPAVSTEMETLRHQMGETEAEIQALSIKNAELQRSLTDLAALRAKNESQIENLNSTLLAKKKEIASTTTERDDFKAQLKDLTTTLQDEKTNSTKLDKEKNETESQLENLKKELHQLEQHLSTIGADNESLRNQLRENEFRIQELSKLNEDLTASKEELTTLRVQLESQIGDLTITLKDKEQEIARLNKTLAHNAEENQNLIDSLKAAEAKNSKLDQKQKDTAIQLKDAQTNHTALELQLDTVLAESKTLLQKISENKATSQELSQQNNAMTKLQKELGALRDQLNEQVIEHNKSLKAKEAEIAGKKLEHDHLAKQFEMLTGEHRNDLEKNNKLNEQLIETARQLECVKTERDTLNRQITDVKDKNIEFLLQHQVKETLIQQLSQKNEDLAASQSLLAEKCTNLENRITQLKATLENKASENKVLIVECDRLALQIEELNSALRTTHAKSEDLENQKKELEQQLEAAKITRKALETQLNDVGAENITLRSQIQQTTSENARLSQTLSQKDNELTDIRSNLTTILFQKNAEIESIISEINDQTKQTETLQTQIDKGTAAQSLLNDEIERLNSESRDTRCKIINLEYRNEGLENKLKTATKERDEINASLLSSNKENTRLQDGLTQLNEYHQQLYKENAVLADSLKTLEEQCLTQKNDLDKLKTSEELSSKLYDRKNYQCDSLQIQLDDLQSKYHFTTGKLEELTAQKKEIESELDISQKERGRLLHKLKNSRSENESLKQKINTSEAAINVLTQEKKTLADDNNLFENKLNQLNETINEKELNITTLSEKLSALKVEIETQKNDSKTARAEYDKDLDILNQSIQNLTSQLEEKKHKIILFDVITSSNMELTAQLESLTIKYRQVSSSQKEDQTNQQIHLASLHQQISQLQKTLQIREAEHASEVFQARTDLLADQTSRYDELRKLSQARIAELEKQLTELKEKDGRNFSLIAALRDELDQANALKCQHPTTFQERLSEHQNAFENSRQPVPMSDGSTQAPEMEKPETLPAASDTSTPEPSTKGISSAASFDDVVLDSDAKAYVDYLQTLTGLLKPAQQKNLRDIWKNERQLAEIKEVKLSNTSGQLHLIYYFQNKISKDKLPFPGLYFINPNNPKPISTTEALPITRPQLIKSDDDIYLNYINKSFYDFLFKKECGIDSKLKRDLRNATPAIKLITVDEKLPAMNAFIQGVEEQIKKDTFIKEFNLQLVDFQQRNPTHTKTPEYQSLINSIAERKSLIIACFWFCALTQEKFSSTDDVKKYVQRATELISKYKYNDETKKYALHSHYSLPDTKVTRSFLMQDLMYARVLLDNTPVDYFKPRLSQYAASGVAPIDPQIAKLLHLKKFLDANLETMHQILVDLEAPTPPSTATAH
ncbi:MAG: golgin subfamily er 4-like [Parachlamydiales bacterium]|nr:golgin subfamily er 4-like [Parachlamydiales bacterium]